MALLELRARALLAATSGPSPRVEAAAALAAIERAPDRALEVDCIVFSKDRPMQLDACLRSILRHAPYRGSITVVHRATTPEFQRGYDQLDVPARIRLVPQGSDFRGAVLDALRDTGELVVFHTDDEIFFRSPPRTPLLPEGCAAFSLRLGENTTYCYPFARDQPLPSRERAGDVMVWRWDEAVDDFAYPLSLNGHVLGGELTRSLVRATRFRDPNGLEEELHLRRHRVPRLMASFVQSCVVAIPANIVTDSIVNREGGNPRYSAAALNEAFLRGERVDLDSLDVARVRAAHQEIPLVLSSAGSR